jgi:single-strand DNA-binding protein
MGRGRETGYIDASSFGASGEAAARTLAKGWLVAVEGRLEQHCWSAQDGSARQAIGIVGHVQFLAAPRGAGAES